MYQGNQQGTAYSQNAQQPYHAGGYVQSHYQGQLSQPSFGQPGVLPGGYQASSHQPYASQTHNSYQNYTPASQSLGPVISRVGWQAGPDLQQSTQQHNYAPVHTYNQQASSNQSYTAGPVISRYGYQAGPDSYGPVNQAFQQHQPQQYAYQQQHAAQSTYQPSFYGAHATTSATHQHPVYQATNAYAEAGPVIQHFGGWESNQR
ncbi:hypothetical protein [Paenibacillus sp. MMS18-CY102]|uniref:hypothetical protein n=1 Tax=Paenibacillus sp. MMS18-CY102 TaxID=2682849 RepID=UPI0013651B48|nr:hypothetical protein [Paenibacillus sp. MMS18-CY102]MWC26766.1 hypothetical protein [Paenibacillus sp. MMS18-CY102]